MATLPHRSFQHSLVDLPRIPFLHLGEIHHIGENEISVKSFQGRVVADEIHFHASKGVCKGSCSLFERDEGNSFMEYVIH